MGKVFFDNNILLYVASEDAAKADRVEALLEQGGVISIQTLNEFVSVARRKIKLSWPEIREFLSTFRTICDVVPITLELHEEGLRIAERYGFTIYDSLIVAAALNSGCDTLYSEDLQDQQVIGQVIIRDPFKST